MQNILNKEVFPKYKILEFYLADEDAILEDFRNAIKGEKDHTAFHRLRVLFEMFEKFFLSAG